MKYYIKLNRYFFFMSLSKHLKSINSGENKVLQPKNKKQFQLTIYCEWKACLTPPLLF